MRRHQHRGARRVDLAQELEDAARRALVEVSGWLVGDEHEWIVDQRPRERDALLFAAGQLRGQAVAFDASPTCVSARATLPAMLRLRRSDDLERERDVRLRGAVLEQSEVLKDDAEPAAQLRPRPAA